MRKNRRLLVAVIARIESLILNNGMDDALIRANPYNAGADGIMIQQQRRWGRNRTIL